MGIFHKPGLINRFPIVERVDILARVAPIRSPNVGYGPGPRIGERIVYFVYYFQQDLYRPGRCDGWHIKTEPMLFVYATRQLKGFPLRRRTWTAACGRVRGLRTVMSLAV